MVDIDKVQDASSPCPRCRLNEVCMDTCADIESLIHQEGMKLIETHKLTKLQKEIKYLRINKEMSWPEMSKELKMTEGAIWSIYKRLQARGSIKIREREGSRRN